MNGTKNNFKEETRRKSRNYQAMNSIKSFALFCTASVGYLDLGLTIEQRICLLKECREVARHYTFIYLSIFCEFGLSKLYTFLRRYNVAIEYLEKILLTTRTHDLYNFECPVYLALKNLYLVLCAEVSFASAHHLNLGLNKEQQIVLFKEMLNIFYTNDNNCLKFFSNLGLAELSREVEQYDNAASYFRTSLQLLEKYCVDSEASLSLKMYLYLDLADTCRLLSQYDDAILYCNKCIDMTKKTSKTKTVELDAYDVLKKIYMSLNKYNEAILYIKRILEFAVENGDKTKEMEAHDELGNMYRFLHKFEKAVLCFKKSLSCATETDDTLLTYLKLGDTYLSLNKYDEARSCGQKVTEMAKKTGSKFFEMRGHSVITRSILTNAQDFIFHCNKVIEIAKQIGDKIEEMQGYLELCRCYGSLNEHSKVVSYSKMCIEVAKNIDQGEFEMQACEVIAKAYLYLRQYDDAISFGKKCIEIAKKNENKEAEFMAYLLLGKASESQEQYEDASLYAKKCTELAIEIDDAKIKIRAYLFFGKMCQCQYRYRDVIFYAQECIEISKEINDKYVEMQAYILIGEAYSMLCQHQDAITFWKKAYDLSLETHNEYFEMIAHSILANNYLKLRELDKAFKHINKGINLLENVNCVDVDKWKYTFNFSLDTFYNIIGMPEKALKLNSSRYKDQGNYQDHLHHLEKVSKTNDISKKQEALQKLFDCPISDEHEEAIEFLKKIKELPFGPMQAQCNAFCNLNIAKCYIFLKEYDKAIEHLKNGISDARECKEKSTLLRCCIELGRIHFLLQNFDEAKNYYQDAIEGFEEIMDSLQENDDFKLSLVDKFCEFYKDMAMLFINCRQTKHLKDSLLVLERCRARALKDRVMAKYGMSKEQDVNGHLTFEDITLLDSATSSILFYSIHPRDFLSYLPNFKDEEKKGLISIQRIENLNDYFEELVKKALKEIMEMNQPTNYQDHINQTEKDKDGRSSKSSLEELYDKLLGKVMPFIEKHEIVIIPDGPLNIVPFAALRDPDTGRYLSETKRTRLSPSITALKMLKECPVDYHCKEGVLIIGDPLVGKVMFDGKETEFRPLENAFCEAHAVGSALHATPLTRENATKEAVIEKLQQGLSVIHIAAHGSLTKGRIALAPSPEIRASKIPDEEDYMLTMADVQKAQVRAQLVVLSCCHSGRGEIRAEGVVGMCRAFLASGARAVVASLWAIDDEASLEFMTRFYQNISERKLSASMSLQEAMNDIRNIADYREPKYWAPFFLMGDDVTLKF